MNIECENCNALEFFPEDGTVSCSSCGADVYMNNGILRWTRLWLKVNDIKYNLYWYSDVKKIILWEGEGLFETRIRIKLPFRTNWTNELLAKYLLLV